MTLQLPEGGSDLLQGLWRIHVLPRLERLQEQREVVLSYSPPTDVAIDEYLSNCDKPDIQDDILTLASLKQEVAALEKQLKDYAYEMLSKPSNADERASVKQKFNQDRNALLHHIHSLRTMAEHEELFDILEFVDNLEVPNLAKANSRSNDQSDMRKWLQENGHNVKDRGRIPLDKQAIYNNRNN